MSKIPKPILALLLAAALWPATGAAQTTHIVNQVGSTFSPADITIQVGDTVRWVWSSNFHTVTSGTGAAAANAGALFDEPLNEFAPTVQFQFTQAGVVPYFCRPHEGLNMKGTVTVEEIGTATPPAAVGLRVSGLEPNPFNPQATLRFTLAEPGPVTVVVYDARGRQVRHLADGIAMEAGDRSLVWDGRDDAGMAVSSGVYLFAVRHAGLEQVARGVLVR